VNIVVQNLQESDGGDYKCQAISQDEEQTQLQQVLLVVVKNSMYRNLQLQHTRSYIFTL
jgi:hypothetical protein